MAITKIEVPELFDFGSDNSAFKLPTGTTAERPTSPSNGEMRFNTTTGYVEYYDTTDAQWWEIDYAPDPVVPSENFDAVLYTGGSQQTVSLSFEPDFIWLKSRGGNYGHMLFDSVSGIDLPNDYYMQSNTTAAQVTSTNRFTLNGTTMTIPVGSNVINSSAGSPYVMWYWKAGGAAVSNTDGSITSQVSANVDAGFSISTFTSNASTLTAGHGLNSTPDLIIVKATSFADSWFVNSIGLTNRTDRALRLNQTSAEETNNAFWNNTAPTSTTFSLGSGVSVSGNSYVAYSWHSVAGYSKIGSYTGNGSATGPIVTTGFEPAWVMIKRTDGTAGAWSMFDNKRDPSNPVQKVLQAQDGAAEANVGNACNFNSNNFQLTDTNSQRNTNGGTYIFMAFAADPT